MGIRRKGREAALQLLYEIDLVDKAFHELLAQKHHWRDLPLSSDEETPDSRAEIEEFAEQLVAGVNHNAREIDALIENHSTHWKISRMSLVDRNILRMAVFEMLYCPEIPSSVSINEAIDIAKKFGSEESGSFVNGVLDHIAKALQKK